MVARAVSTKWEALGQAGAKSQAGAGGKQRGARRSSGGLEGLQVGSKPSEVHTEGPRGWRFFGDSVHAKASGSKRRVQEGNSLFFYVLVYVVWRCSGGLEGSIS